MLTALAIRAQWDGYELKSIATTPTTDLETGFYALYQNGHKGFAFVSTQNLTHRGTTYNLAKSRINSSSPGITALANMNLDIATGPAPDDRRWYVFKITNNGDGTCTIQCADGKYMPEFGNRVKLSSSETAGTLEFIDHGNYFSFKNNGQGLDGDAYGANYADVSTLATWDYSTPTATSNNAWTLYKANMQPVEYATSITSGKYYRLMSNAYNGKFMAASSGGGLVLAAKDLKKSSYGYYAQLWQIVESNGSYKFRNLASGQHIQAWPGQSQQWKTGSVAASFYSGSSVSGSNTVYWFATVNNQNEHKSLHAAGANNQNNTVVGWQASSPASKWLLQEVEVSEADIEAASDWQKTFDPTLGSKLARFFNDAACSELKDDYAAMTDDELREAMAALPTMLREEAVCVKNNKWNRNATWSRHEKGFRIHDYEVYSAPGVWGAKLGYGDCTRLTQPTGIRAKAGEIVYLLVDSNVKDGDASLAVDQVVGLNINSSQQTALTKGLNIVTAVDDCEFFITYLNSNTEKPLSNYPDIKVHIVGGTCNGTFDIVRGHTNSDWTWLSQNMMKHTYLHVRTENHTFCGYLSELKTMTSQLVESLQMLDWGFQSQERTMSRHYGKGYYRPVVIVTDHGWGINPNAGNGRISWPGINKGYLLNTSSILNADWWPCWAFPHEHGHMRQKPLWMAGMREISNEALVQIYTHEWGRKTAKGSQTKLANHFNEGRSWVDIFKGDALLPTMAWYQLWLYFRQMGDTEFFARWIECIKNRGLFQSRFTSWENPARIDKDYMLMALAACEAAQTDLYEYFKTWGFFNYAEQVNGTNDNGVVHVADYESYYLKVPRSSVASEVKLMEQWKKEMQAYEKKAPGAMFINSSSRSRNIDANDGCAKFDRSLIGQAVGFFENDADRGCTGYFLDYGKTNIGNIAFRQNNLSITVTGTGVVGIKIYDDKGELIRISYFKTFSVPKAVADGIADGTYSLVASLTDCTDLLLSGPPTAYTTERQTGIAHTSLNKEESNAWYTLGGLRLSQPPTQKGVYIKNKKKVIIK